MKLGDKVYIVESNKIKEVEVIKVTRDFVTVRYQTVLPGFDEYARPVYSVGGFRLRKNRVFETEAEARKHIVL